MRILNKREDNISVNNNEYGTFKEMVKDNCQQLNNKNLWTKVHSA